jgi:hypothetical protein
MFGGMGSLALNQRMKAIIYAILISKLPPMQLATKMGNQMASNSCRKAVGSQSGESFLSLVSLVEPSTGASEFM